MVGVTTLVVVASSRKLESIVVMVVLVLRGKVIPRIFRNLLII